MAEVQMVGSQSRRGSGAVVVAHAGFQPPPAAETAEPVRADPPLLKGGSLRDYDAWRAVSRGVDYFTWSMSIDLAERLKSSEWIGERLLQFTPRGFVAGERLMCLGGELSRRFEPRVASNEFGFEYESWEISGGHADSWAKRLRGEKVRPSRIDVAWDYEVAEDVKAQDVHACWLAHMQAFGVKAGHNADGDDWTCYAGGRSSDRSVKVYRKDLQSPMLAFAGLIGPRIRVELTLRNESALRWWLLWSQDVESAFAGAAGVVESLTGFRPQSGVVELPQLVEPEGLDEVETLYHFVKQHGDRIRTWAESGISVEKLAGITKWNSSNRMADLRRRRRLKAIRDLGPANIIRLLRERLLPPEAASA